MLPIDKKDYVILVRALSSYLTDLIKHEDLPNAERCAKLLDIITHEL